MAANILARRYPGWNQASPWFPVALDVPKGRVVFQRGRLRVHLAALSWTLTYIVIVWALVCVGLAFDQSSVLALGLAVAWIAVPRNVLRVGSKVTVSRRLGMKIVGFGAARGGYVALNASPANTPRSWAISSITGPAVDLLAGTFALLMWLAIGMQSSSIAAEFVRDIGLMHVIAVVVSLLGRDGFVIRLALIAARQSRNASAGESPPTSSHGPSPVVDRHRHRRAGHPQTPSHTATGSETLGPK
ncbi:MAG TPA: hypothetical protein VHQ23_04165 [Ilumatobacteraceae bacterium]|nr:hypothetical protein [Ilumatobacteraceae bacterium]